MVRRLLGNGPALLRFHVRNELHIDWPNSPGVRVPMYEIFAEGAHRLEGFLGPLLEWPTQLADIGAV